MLFNSIEFFIFFILYLVLFHITKGSRYLVFIANYVFYSFFDIRFLPLIIFSTISDYLIAKHILSKGNKKLGITLSLFFNLSALGIFKYLNLFCDVFNLNNSMCSINIVLPVGISFYTFQTISYVIDVAKGKVTESDNFVDFATYVAFFPQLVAGPIERFSYLNPQLKKLGSKGVNYSLEGLYLITTGLIRKVLLGDTLGELVQEKYMSLSSLSSGEVLVLVLAFAGQIYFDFSGYTEIARGLAKMMHINLSMNFRRPYFSRNVKEFWSRWHISLSNWLRDYLYIPLGGNKNGISRQVLAIIVTMGLGGIWHGANLKFFYWGIYHAIGILVFHIFSRIIDKKFPYILSVAMTFVFVVFGWTFFIVSEVSEINILIKQLLVSKWNIEDLKVALSVVLLFSFDIFSSQKVKESIIKKLSPYFLTPFFLTIIFVIYFIIVEVKSAKPFIYFQF